MSTKRSTYRSGRTEIVISIDDADDQHVVITIGRSIKVSTGVSSPKTELWMGKYVDYVPEVISWSGKIKYLKITRISGRGLIRIYGAASGLWMESDMLPRSYGYVTS